MANARFSVPLAMMDIEGMTEQRAGELIMTARAPWFAEADEQS